LGWGGGEAALVILKLSKLNNFKLLLIFNYELWEEEKKTYSIQRKRLCFL
jgi:hypothetical protein